MQGKSATLSLFAITVLALATVPPLWGQQPTGQVRKLTPSPRGVAVYEDTKWSPDQDIQLMKSNIRSQKIQIVAANMDLTDAEAEKFWPVYDRYATDLAKLYDSKLAPFQEYRVKRPGYADPIQFKVGNPYGASFTSNNGALKPDETALASARFQGRRVAELAAQFVDGRKKA
jgi:hypothetical protein